MRTLLTILALIASGCGLHKVDSDSGSDLKQLNRNTVPCKNWDPARVEQIKPMVAAYSSEYMQSNSKWSQKYFNGMAGIPDTYLQWMSQRASSDRFTISSKPFRSGGSYTAWGRGNDRIKLDPSSWGYDYSLQHEVGHYVQLFVNEFGARQRGLSEQQFHQELAEVASKTLINPNLHNYPKSYANRGNMRSYRAEFWAEAFNSYYCSEETNKDLQTTFTDVYVFLKKYLEPPLWEPRYPPINSIFVYLRRNPQNANELPATFAAPKGVGRLFLCLDTEEACKASNAEDVEIPQATFVPLHANFFKIPHLFQKKTSQYFTIRAFDGQNQQLVPLTRAVTLQN